MRRVKSIWLLVLVLLSCSLPAAARVNVVTLPGRDTVQLTIYNSVDLTMVKETRLLTFRKGVNKLEFSWANTQIDPTSVEFRALSHADEVEVLDVRFPPRVANTLEWHIQSEVSGEIRVEIRYFTKGISWAADYVAEVAGNERSMKLNGAVKVMNNSGEDYENAQVRLVVGVIRLVEEIVAQNHGLSDLAELPAATKRGYMAFYGEVNKLQGRAKEVTKESLSEYFLYTVEGRDTIPNGWAKMLPSFSAPNVAFASYYKYEIEQWGEGVIRFYTFTNNIAGNLGHEPLPDGVVHAFRLASPDALYSFQGASSFKYIPINEKVELNLGSDPEVTIRPRLMSWSKQDLRFDNQGNVSGWTVVENWEIEVQNSKEIEVTVDIRRNFPGDWSATSTPAHEKLDAEKIKFLLQLKPRSSQTVSYQLTTRHGTNAQR